MVYFNASLTLLILPAFCLLSMLPGLSCLRLKQLSVPRYASLGEPVSMGCTFELDQAKLYSVKWYKDGDEFCRFMPASQPPIQLFSASGINMEESGCGMTSVTLLSASLDTSGSYRCEVSTESPKFQTVFRTENLTVRALPHEDPFISGVASSYTPGEWVVARCTAGASLPPATMQWTLNGNPVDQSWVTGSVPRGHEDLLEDDDFEDDLDIDDPPPPEHTNNDPLLLSSRTTVRFQARPEHFTGPSRELWLRCEARVHEKSYRAERRTSLAGPGGNQHLRDEEPRNNAGVCRVRMDVTVIIFLLITSKFAS